MHRQMHLGVLSTAIYKMCPVKQLKGTGQSPGAAVFGGWRAAVFSLICCNAAWMRSRFDSPAGASSPKAATVVGP